MSTTAERIIHIEWDGPFRKHEVSALNAPSDKGIYQIYASHPLYGYTLVYIGKTETTFSDRPLNHNWETGSETDPENVRYYLGRLKGLTTPNLAEWGSDIRAAEALLIASHAPGCNNQYCMNPPSKDLYGHIRVLNWGRCNRLSREVSGLIWTSAGDQYSSLRVYGRD